MLNIRNQIQLILIFLLFCSVVGAQNYKFIGRVVDSKSSEPLAFVNIIVNDGKYGTATDIDGKFILNSANSITYLSFSYVGYESQKIPIDPHQKSIVVRLVKTTYQLSEVVIIPGENPAHRIIKKVIENVELNDPENINAFSYTSYDKMIFTADVDSTGSDSFIGLYVDSADIKLKKYLEDKHFFMMESVAKRKFLSPDKSYQKVIATRISGFKDPMFVFLISQMQSFSFYKPLINIFDKNYVNPISKGSINKYLFVLEDTTYNNNDTVFIISFRPGKNKNFDGMEGLLYINTNKYAIQNVIAQPSRLENDLEVKIQQMYELIDGERWFPVQLNTEIAFNNITTGSFKIVGIGKSYIRDIVLNEEYLKSEFSNVEVDIDPQASDRPEEYWEEYRVDSLSRKELNTYRVIDSIGKVHKFDKIARLMDALITGYIPWGFINFDINKFMRYNEYEGYYLGIGIHTNERLSDAIRLGGYWGYGFKDKRQKYGGDMQLFLDKRYDFSIKFTYMNDVTESGSVEYFEPTKGYLSNERLRNFLIKRMDITESFKTDISFRPFKYLLMNVGLNKSIKQTAYPYYFGKTEKNVTIGINEFYFTEISLGVRYAYHENFIRNSRKKISLGTNYPVLRFQYIRGLNNLIEGEYSYNRFDLRVDKSVYIKYFGRSSFVFKSGFIDSNIPATNLYNGYGSYYNFSIFAPFSFATMRMNEFLVNRYVSLFYLHNFGKLLLRTKIFSPEIAIAANAGYGWLSNPDNHYGISVKDFDKGYYEAGLILNSILDFGFYNLGAGVFYRFGPYSFNKANKNLAWKLSFLLPV